MFEEAKQLEGVSDQVLADRLSEFAGALQAATSRFIYMVGEFESRSLWFKWGCRSTADWLSAKCGIDTSTARQQVRVATCLRTLPKTRALFDAGRLSYSQVRALTRVANADNEDMMLEIAEHATASQLEKLLRAYRSAIEGVPAANLRHQKRSFHSYTDDDQMVVMKLRLTPEDAAVIEQAMLGSTQEVPPLDDSAAFDDQAFEPRAALRADLLVQAARRSLSAFDNAESKPSEMILEVQEKALDNDPSAIATYGDQPVCGETARRLSCDAAVTEVRVDALRRPLSVGRRQRTVPKWLKKALDKRDAGCRFPGCGQSRFTEAHHIVHWKDGGETSLTNLAKLCWFHHRMAHEGRYQIHRLESGTLIFRDPRGALIEQVKPDAESIERLDRQMTGHKEPFPMAASWGQKIDIKYAVSVMIPPEELPESHKKWLDDMRNQRVEVGAAHG